MQFHTLALSLFSKCILEEFGVSPLVLNEVLKHFELLDSSNHYSDTLNEPQLQLDLATHLNDLKALRPL